MSRSGSVSSASIRRKVEEERAHEAFPEEYLRDDYTESRRREARKNFYDEGYKEERVLRLSRSRSGYVGSLTRLYNDIQDLIANDKGNVGDILSKYERFGEAWYKFVDAHEKYFGLLDNESDRDLPSASYEEQKIRKLQLDNMVTDWHDMVESPRRSEFKPGSKRSSLKSHSSQASNLSIISKKREDIALAQLKLEQLKVRQSFEEKEQSLKRMEEVVEAEMEINRAAVSLEVYQQVEDEMESTSKGDLHQEHLKSFSLRSENVSAHRTSPNENGRSIGNVVRGASQREAVISSSNPRPYTHQTLLLPRDFDSALPERKYFPSSNFPSTNFPSNRNNATDKIQTASIPQLEKREQEYHSLPETFARIGPSTMPSRILKNPTVVAADQGFNHIPTVNTYNLLPKSSALNPYATTWPPSTTYNAMAATPAPAVNAGLDMVQALRQIANTPKLEYLRFDGEPMKYGAFIHNFENFLERDSPDESRKLQLLIQHCSGKAKEAIESCVSLPNEDGYRVAKNTLYENFGKPYIIAEAHIKKLMSLPNLKNGDGPSLLQFARHLETAQRTLIGMGHSYGTDLDHMHVLRELAKKLPMFLRARWTEFAGNQFETGLRPRFEHFLKFIKERAKLVNNEFGRDMTTSYSKLRSSGKDSVESEGKSNLKYTSFTASEKEEAKNLISPGRKSICEFCSGPHRIWNCARFKAAEYKTKRKIVLQNGLCNKCLEKGHIARTCPKTYFQCQEHECGEPHHTLMHRPSNQLIDSSKKQGKATKSSQTQTGACDQEEISGRQSNQSSSVGTTHAGESRICLGAIPLRVRGIAGMQEVQTYTLLDNGSEVTLWDERLAEKLNIDGETVNFTLTGINGSVEVKSKLVDIVVTSLDGSTEVEFQKVKTVKEIPISKGCIPKQLDVNEWSHLHDLCIPELEDGNIMLLIGVKEKPRLFLPLECREGGDGEPIAIRYNLGWTVMGPIGGNREDEGVSVNFTRVKDQIPTTAYHNFAKLNESEECLKGDYSKFVQEEKGNFRIEIPNCLPCDEIECQNKENAEDLTYQLQRLWNTDFEVGKVTNKVVASIEDKKALQTMEKSIRLVNGHFQVALPWREDTPNVPNNKIMAEKRLWSLKNRLTKDTKLFENYTRAMQDYIDKGHAQKVPEEELKKDNGRIWYLPHHPVTHRLKPDKTRIVFDCAAKFNGQSLNDHLLSGPDLTNSLQGVLIRFRQEAVAVVADIESMFYQVLVEPEDCDVFRFLWWENHDLKEPPTEYRMVKHVFGATSSPSVANFSVKKTASSFGENYEPEVRETIEKNMYVDDLMKSVDQPEKAMKLSNQLQELLKEGGFRLTKWLSNDGKVLAEIPESERAKSVVNLEIDKLPTECALGVKWNVETDKFLWEVREETLALAKLKLPTRRGMLSVIYSLFDPIGFIVPYLMKAKLLLQELC